MQIDWLNDSLMLRADSDAERMALSVMYLSLGGKEPADSAAEVEGCEAKALSAS